MSASALRCATALAVAAVSLAPVVALAQAGPVVIPAPAYAAPAAQPVSARSSGGGALGGGFIEFLVSGTQAPAAARSAAPAVTYAPPGTMPGRVPGNQVARLEPGHQVAPRPQMDPRFQRQEVAYGGSHAPGTIVIDTSERFLYHVQPGGRAMRYGVGVGREGFEWSGSQTITRKEEWPDWRPPEQMLRRRPDLPRFMEGGPDNPMGARALYLGSTLYRIHGTNEPWTIGTAMSSGCIRMTNEDVTHLYERVRIGARVIVQH